MRVSQTWREYLGQLLAQPSKMQQISEALAISPITLQRWVNGESPPRWRTLYRLLQILPDQQEQLLPLICEEFPSFANFPSLTDNKEEALCIPSEFYRQVTRTRAYTPSTLLFTSLVELIVQEALTQLDPGRLGMAVIVARCMPPSYHGKVRSLLAMIGRGTSPWSQTLDLQVIFFGIESLAGYAVASGHLALNQRLTEPELGLTPGYRDMWEASAVVVPIMYAGGIAGCLLAYSVQPDYFVPPLQSLMEAYAELLTLAFTPEEFYSPEQIELGVMPRASVQRTLQAAFRCRVLQRIQMAIQTNQMLTVFQAEQEVRQQCEQELLQCILEDCEQELLQFLLEDNVETYNHPIEKGSYP